MDSLQGHIHGWMDAGSVSQQPTDRLSHVGRASPAPGRIHIALQSDYTYAHGWLRVIIAPSVIIINLDCAVLRGVGDQRWGGR